MIKTTENKFTKENLIKDGQYLIFGSDRISGKFVARFKYRRCPVTLSKFRKELIASHTPASYFGALQSGKSPLEILKEANPLWHSKIMNAFALSA